MSMVLRKLLPYFSIHPTLVAFVLISFLTGTFIQLFMIIFIVTIHELGHFFAAKYFGWRIERVVLWAFGGVMITDEFMTRPAKEELIVIVSGPLQHGFLFLFIFTLQHVTSIPDPIIAQMYYYNAAILLFNLLPIYPLDGGKLILLLWSSFTAYRQAYRFVLVFSFVIAMVILTMQFFIFSFTLTATLLIIFLLLELHKYWRHEYFTFMRFLLYRLDNTSSFNKIKCIYADRTDRLIDLFNQFHRNQTHRLYLTPHTFISERRALHYYFNEKKYDDTVFDIVKGK